MNKAIATETNDNQEREYSRRELLKMLVPKEIFPAKGILTIDKTRCSGCALCAQECATGALTVEGEDSIRILFHFQLCDSCGECVSICPEKCLKLEDRIEKKPLVVLFEDEYARCSKCGVVIGSQAMIKQIRAKFINGDPKIIENLSRCPACKGKK